MSYGIIDEQYPQRIAIVLGPCFGTGNAEYMGLKAGQTLTLQRIPEECNEKQLAFSEDGTNVIKWRRDGSVAPNRIKMRMRAGSKYSQFGYYTYSSGMYAQMRFYIDYGRGNYTPSWERIAPTQAFNTGVNFTWNKLQANYCFYWGMYYSSGCVPQTGMYYPSYYAHYKYCYLPRQYVHYTEKMTYHPRYPVSYSTYEYYQRYRFKNVFEATYKYYGGISQFISAMFLGTMQINVREKGAKRVDVFPADGTFANIYAYENVQVGDPEWMTSHYREQFYASFWDYEFMAQDDVFVEDYLYSMTMYTV